MTNAAVDFSLMEKYLLQSDTSVVLTVKHRDTKSDAGRVEPVFMNGREMKSVETETHLAMRRAVTLSKTREINVEEFFKTLEE